MFIRKIINSFYLFINVLLFIMKIRMKKETLTCFVFVNVRQTNIQPLKDEALKTNEV